jgi:UDP-glucose 4-epimerase
MKQRNWRCDMTPAMKELNFIPEYNLERGVKETVAWYKKEKWL